MNKVIVIGGGPAGIMAAGIASQNGSKVILIEKNNKLGKKLLITGKGRCNLTNTTDIEEIIKNTPGNGSFLYSSLYTFSNEDLISFFNSLGLETKVERGGRVFPESDSSEDVLKALYKFLNMNNVTIKYSTAISHIDVRDGSVYKVITENGEQLECDRVILATGGATYKLTGSSGDGYRISNELGHNVTEIRPSLVPLVVKEEWIKELQGLSLKNVSIKLLNKRGKTLYSDFGEMLFTHFGVSGPVILSSSRFYENEDIKLVIDLKPALTFEKLDSRIQRDFEKNINKIFKNSLDELLPKKIIPVIVSLSGISPEKQINQISKQERQKLVETLKEFTLTIKGTRPLNEGIITRGGIDIKQINPSTMESKLVKGLYFAGEIIDVDAYTGGYNLTIAFSTGYLAGLNSSII